MTVRVDGQLIRQLRIKRSYSQERLAEIVGVNLRTIQRMETNGVASLSTRGALAKALGVKPEDLDVREAPATAVASGEHVSLSSRWPVLMLSSVLVVLGATVLFVSIISVTPIGLVTLPAAIGLLIALVGFVLLTRLTPFPRWRTYVVLSIVGISMVVSPPSWAVRALVAISLWAAFELGILAARLRPPERLTDS